MRVLIICLILFLCEVYPDDKFANFIGGDSSKRSEHKEDFTCFSYDMNSNKINVDLCNKNFGCPIDSYLHSEDIEIKCKARYLKGSSIDGESCEKGEDCASGECDEGKCVGLSGESKCVDHLQCAKGKFCSSEGRCVDLKAEGSECSSDSECETDLLCFNGQCTKMFSQPYGTEVENSLMCESGLAVNINQKYICSYIQTIEGQCTSSSDFCEAKILYGKFENGNDKFSYFNIPCQETLSVNSEGIKEYACPLSNEDEEYKSAFEGYKKALVADRHTSRRFDPNGKLYFKYYTYKYYPLFKPYKYEDNNSLFWFIMWNKQNTFIKQYHWTYKQLQIKEIEPKIECKVNNDNLGGLIGQIIGTTSGTTSFFVINSNYISKIKVDDKGYTMENLSSFTSEDTLNTHTVQIIFNDNFGQIQSLGSMFSNYYTITEINFINIDTSNIKDMGYMFYNCISLSSLNLGDNFNTQNVTNMGDMFSGCTSLSELNLSKFNTQKVTDMGYMFQFCTSLISLNLGDNFNTINVTNMIGMFGICESLSSLNLGDKFNTQSVTNMEWMFYNCKSLSELNLGDKFNTTKVENMEGMFYNCESLSELNLGPNFTINTNTITSNMFFLCDNLCTLTCCDSESYLDSSKCNNDCDTTVMERYNSVNKNC